MKDMELAAMKPDQVPQIAALEAASFSAPWDEASIRAELDNPLALWLTAADPTGRVLGYVGSQSCFEEADVLNVCVLPAARRRGVAEALMLALEARLLPRGVEQISLEVRVSNLPALRLYEKLGYRQVGLRRNYYEKPREDAWILQKKLGTRGACCAAAKAGEPS